jgi:hypothetical protein
MASFTLDGQAYEYLRPDPDHPPEACHSWTYGQYPKVMASLPLAGGGTVDVYAHADRWDPSHILVSWPAGNVRRVTDSEWDIEEYRRRPDKIRGVQWRSRLPGFLPE